LNNINLASLGRTGAAMLEKFVDWVIWLSTGVPEVWISRQSPLFGVARAFWVMFILLALMYLISATADRLFSRRALRSKGRNADLDRKLGESDGDKS
jgi:hypothetical protein